MTPDGCNGTPRQAFEAAEIKVGDLVRYPAILRREHNDFRSPLRVTRVDGRRIWGTNPDESDGFEYVIEPLQIELNGVLVDD